MRPDSEFLEKKYYPVGKKNDAKDSSSYSR